MGTVGAFLAMMLGVGVLAVRMARRLEDLERRMLLLEHPRRNRDRLEAPEKTH